MGQRHNTLVKYISILFNACFPEEESMAKLSEWNKLNKPPLPERELIATVKDCYQRWEDKFRKTISGSKT